MRNDVSGSYVDIEKFIRGEPECMQEFEIQTEPRFATLIVSGSASGCVDPDTIKERGLKIMEVIDTLERHNIRTKVIQNFKAINYEYTDLISVVCKDYKSRLDLEALNFAIRNPAQLRRFVFSVMERSPRDWREKMGFMAWGGYGRPSEITSDILEKEGIVSSCDNYIIFNSSAGEDYSDIDKQVKQLITKQGIK